MFALCSRMIETLGEALDAGWRLTARCARGKREAMKTVRARVETYELDLRTLVWTRGRAFPLSSLETRLGARAADHGACSHVPAALCAQSYWRPRSDWLKTTGSRTPTTRLGLPRVFL